MINLGNRTGQVAAAWLDFCSGQGRKVNNQEGGSLHDAVALAWLIDPTLVRSQMMHVAVELKGDLTRRMTVCDWRWPGYTGEGLRHRHPPNVEVCFDPDAAKCKQMLFDVLT